MRIPEKCGVIIFTFAATIVLGCGRSHQGSEKGKDASVKRDAAGTDTSGADTVPADVAGDTIRQLGVWTYFSPSFEGVFNPVSPTYESDTWAGGTASISVRAKLKIGCQLKGPILVRPAIGAGGVPTVFVWAWNVPNTECGPEYDAEWRLFHTFEDEALILELGETGKRYEIKPIERKGIGTDLPLGAACVRDGDCAEGGNCVRLLETCSPNDLPYPCAPKQGVGICAETCSHEAEAMAMTGSGEINPRADGTYCGSNLKVKDAFQQIEWPVWSKDVQPPRNDPPTGCQFPPYDWCGIDKITLTKETRHTCNNDSECAEGMRCAADSELGISGPHCNVLANALHMPCPGPAAHGVGGDGVCSWFGE